MQFVFLLYMAITSLNMQTDHFIKNNLNCSEIERLTFESTTKCDADQNEIVLLFKEHLINVINK